MIKRRHPFCTILVLVLVLLGFSNASIGQMSFSDTKTELDSILESNGNKIELLFDYSERYLSLFPKLSKVASRKARDIAEVEGNDSILIEAMINLGVSYNKLKEGDSAISVYLVAKDKAAEANNADQQIRALAKLFYCYKKSLMMKSQATEMVSKLRTFLDQDISNVRRGEIYFTINSYQGYIGNKDSTSIYRDSAEKYWSLSDDPELYGLLLNDKAIHMVTAGDTARALEAYYYIIDRPEMKGARDEALHNAVYILSWLGNHEAADSLAILAIEDAKKSKGLIALIGAQYDLAMVQSYAGNYKEAFESYKKMDILDDSLYSIESSNALAEAQTKYDLATREAELVIQRSQRNFFIILAFLFLAIAAASILIYSNRLRSNKLISAQRIEKLEKEKEVLSLQSMMIAQEEERQRIARDLHDSIGALLSTAKLHISNIQSEMHKLNDVDFLKSTEQAIDRASLEVRRVAHNMMPGVLMKLGLIEGIEDYFDRIRESKSIEIVFTYDELEERLENKQEVMLYRIVQEMVNNTLKHGNAKEIKLKLKVEPEQLVLDYRDDGSGFDAQRFQDESSFGLSSLKSRVAFLQGSIELESQTNGGGVHYRIAAPLNLDKMIIV